MKPLISILLLFSSFVSYSQTSLSDTLESSTGFVYEQIILNIDNTFKYRESTCYSNKVGEGLYAIENNKLILLFYINRLNYKDSNNNCKYLIKDALCDSTKTDLKFKIIDEDNKPLSGATIVVQKIGRGAKSKTDGSASIKNIEKNNIFTVRITNIGFDSCFFNIQTNDCKYIEVQMAVNKAKYIAHGTIMEYKISKLNLDQECFTLTNKMKSLFSEKIEKNIIMD